MTDPVQWAAAYAELGWPILPIWPLRPDGSCACGRPADKCKPGKHPLGPLVPNGLDGATTDQQTHREWFRRYPAANIAVRTGPESGLLVLDVDVDKGGEVTLAKLEREHGPLPALPVHQWTGSGTGWQAFFAYPEGRAIGNSAGRLGAGLDTRGHRGYVVVPPSRTQQAYRWADGCDAWTLPPEPAPDWLLALLDPPPEPARAEWNGHRRPAGLDAYALRALEAELALTAAAPSGRRNDQLNRSAHALFRLCPEGRLHADTVARGLLAAARHTGLAEREALATIRSAAQARRVSL